jgi:hypothetical protein
MTALGSPIPIPPNRLRQTVQVARPVASLAAGLLGRTVRSSGFLLGYGIGRIGRSGPMIPAVSTKCVLTAGRVDPGRPVLRPRKEESASAGPKISNLRGGDRDPPFDPVAEFDVSSACGTKSGLFSGPGQVPDRDGSCDWTS